MKRRILLSLLTMFSVGTLYAISPQSYIDTQNKAATESVDESVKKINLPRIYIQTENNVEPSCTRVEHPEGCVGHSIINNDYVKGEMKIYKNDDLLYNSGKYSKKKSGMRVKVRGNTSSDFPYKSFKVKTEVKTDLLNRNDEKFKSKSWLLLNLYSTRDLRTIAGRYVSEQVGIEWEPRHQFVNLFLNGEYRGLYLLSESIEVSEGRCNLKDPNGLLIEADPYWWNEDPEDPVIKTNHLPYAIGYTFKNPDILANDPLVDEIRGYLNAFEDALYDNKDIEKYIDLKSFAAWILAHDLLGTSDGAGSNIYLTKDDFTPGSGWYNSKLCMGPLWDFDSTLENHNKWSSIHDLDFFYYKELFKRSDFINEYNDLWISIRENIASKTISYIKDFISQEGAAIDESRKIAPPDRWVWRNTVNDNLKEIEDWFEERIPWMDKYISELMEAASISELNKESEISYVAVYDTKGTVCKVLRGRKASDVFCNNKYVNLNLNSGVYLLRAKLNDGNTMVKKYINM